MKLKNKKGFTLIELLAVIVVLAIIALIATPIVMNTIKNAKKGAAERSADNYIKQVETAVAESRIDGTKIANGTYNIQPDGNLCPASGCGENDKNKITIDMSGTKPTSGTVTISNGGVSQNETKLVVGDYNVKYNQEKNKYEATEPYKGILCTKTDGVDLNNLTYGNEFICELGDNDKKTFYVLEDGDTTTLTEGRIAQLGQVSLIMDAVVGEDGKSVKEKTYFGYSWIDNDDFLNMGGTVTEEMLTDGGICEHGHTCVTNEFGPITVNKKLENNTKNWTRLEQLQITLPTAEQIAMASNDKIWTNIKKSNNKLPSWLGCGTSTNGYWTSTKVQNDIYHVWSVNRDMLFTARTGSGADGGLVRPVITIPKSQLG